MKLYRQETLTVLLKKTKDAFVSFWVFLALALLSCVLFIACAFYEMRLLFEILGSLLSLLFVCLALYCFDRNRHFRRLSSEYWNLLSETGAEKACFVKKAKRRPITLSNRSSVYEILIDDGENARSVYLSSLFDMEFEEGKKYRLLLAEDYIKEYDEIA